MQTLAKREEQIMQVIWNLEKAFVKEIIEQLPEPKPHYNTIATMVKILQDKGFLHAEKFGNTYRYEPRISLEDYRKQDVESIQKKYFGGSFSKMLTHFAKEENLSDTDLDEIVRMIKDQKKS